MEGAHARGAPEGPYAPDIHVGEVHVGVDDVRTPQDTFADFTDGLHSRPPMGDRRLVHLHAPLFESRSEGGRPAERDHLHIMTSPYKLRGNVRQGLLGPSAS